MSTVTVTIYEVELGGTTVWGRQDEAEYLESRKKFESFGLELCEFDADSSGYQRYVNQNGPLLCDQDNIMRMLVAGIEVTITREHPVDVSVPEALVAMADKQYQPPRGNSYNTHCEIHMPGQALSVYNDILLMGGACSDELLNSLNAGWRIIAACPQPDQRRPDYILGRYSPETDAKRKVLSCAK